MSLIIEGETTTLRENTESFPKLDVTYDDGPFSHQKGVSVDAVPSGEGARTVILKSAGTAMMSLEDVVGDTPRCWIHRGKLVVGESASYPAYVLLAGGGLSGPGSLLRMCQDNYYDDTVGYYDFSSEEAKLVIRPGPSPDNDDLITLDGVEGSVGIGEDDISAGLLHIYAGDDSGEGAEIRLYNDAENDDDSDYWVIRTYEDRLQIYPEGEASAETLLALSGVGSLGFYGVMSIMSSGTSTSRLDLYAFSAEEEPVSEIRFFKSASDISIADTWSEPPGYEQLGYIEWNGVYDGNWAKGAFILAWQHAAAGAGATSVPAKLELATYKGADTTPSHNQYQILLHPNGRIGFGLTEPQSQLHLHAPGIYGEPFMRFTNDFSGSDSDNGVEVGMESGLDAFLKNWEDGDLFLGTNQVIRMRIKSDGKIGFSTDTPQEWLHAHRDADASCLLRFTNSVTGSDSGDGVDVGLTSVEEAILWNYEDTDMVFGTDNTERMRIENDGKVGIGTGMPGGQLEVKQADEGGTMPVLVLEQCDTDREFIEFQGGTVYNTKDGQDEYIKVKDPSGNTRYLKLYADPS